MSSMRPSFLFPKVALKNLSTNESLKGKRREHIETEAGSSNIDQPVIRGEVIEDVSLRLRGEDEVA